MAFDRSKFKKADVNEINASVKAAQATMRNPSFDNNGYARFFTMKDPGNYSFRILPSISGKPYVPVKTVKLMVEKPVYDKDNKDTGKKERKMSDIFTSDIHCDKMQGKDAAIMYIEYVAQLASEIQDKDERLKFLYPINGYKDRQGKWIWGMSPMMNYVTYVAPYPILNEDIFRLNLQPKWWDRMKEISLERSSDDVLSIDIFSDPEEGYPLKINFDFDANKKRIYTLDEISPAKKETWEEFFEKTSLSDKLLEALSSLPSLDDLYINSFSRKEWDYELEGLQYLDEQAGYNIFSNEQFLDELEALEKLVPSEDEAKSKTQKSAPAETVSPSQTRKIPTPDSSSQSSSTEKTYPSLVKMKSELSAYIKSEYEDTEELPKKLSLAEIKNWYDLMKAGELLPFDDYREESEEEDKLPFNQGSTVTETQPEPVTNATKFSTSPSPAMSARDRLKALREAVNNRK